MRRAGQHVSRQNFLITLQEEADFDVFEPVRARIRAASGQHPQNRGRIISPTRCSIPSSITIIRCSRCRSADRYDRGRAGREPDAASPVGDLHEHRRTLTHIRRYVWPLRDLINSLLHEESGARENGTKVYLRDCYDHTVQLMDLVESYRDVLSGLMEIYLSSVGIRTNEIMRVLTVISSIFIPLTFIAGVYGMNFAPEHDGKKLPWNMPELYSPIGYVGVLLFMLALSLFQIFYFKKKRWL